MMNILPFSGAMMAAGLFLAAPAFAQTVSAKAMITTQPTPKGHVASEDRNSDGPSSSFGAKKQRTQSYSHSAPAGSTIDGVHKQN